MRCPGGVGEKGDKSCWGIVWAKAGKLKNTKKIKIPYENREKPSSYYREDNIFEEPELIGWLGDAIHEESQKHRLKQKEL